jgi:hypothetical protein
MSKDHRFNKKEYGYDDDNFNSYGASSKQSGDKKQVFEQKQKSSFKRIDKRSIA